MDITSYRFTPDDDARISLLLRKMKGDNVADRTASDKLVVHQLPTVSSEDVTGIPLLDAPGASSMMDARDKFVTIADFASVEARDPTVYHTVTRRDALVFIIVMRPEGSRGKLSWDLPTIPQYQDYSNDFISKSFEGDHWEWTRAYIRSGKWGKVGTIILSTESMEALSEFRRQFSLHSYKGANFDMFPKDVLTAKPDVNILLRASMKTFKTDMIPKVLFARNQEVIAGTLRVLATRFFLPGEMSHKGESKEHWRSVELKGDEQFLRCLRFIPESHPFLLGFDSVQIRGGLRPQEDNPAVTTGNKRQWSTANPSPSVPLLTDPRNIFPSHQPDENSTRGAAKKGRGQRGARRGNRSRGGRR